MCHAEFISASMHLALTLFSQHRVLLALYPTGEPHRLRKTGVSIIHRTSWRDPTTSSRWNVVPGGQQVMRVTERG